MASTEQQNETRKALLFPGILGERGDSGVRYYLLNQLNRGTFGEAWTIERVSDSKKFAGKIMFLKELSTKQQLRARTEVSCIRNSAGHFGCVGFVEDATHDDKLLIVMEYCDAGDLRYQIKHLRDNGGNTFSELDVKKIFLQLVLSLNFLHRNHILHRDLKAENVLLSTSGLVKIGDFGMSKEYESTLTAVAQTFCGTPAYISPEVWSQKTYGRQADVWSLGVILYEMMTATFPFVANDWATLAQRVQAGQYAEPDARVYSQELRDLLSACLQVNPQQRIDTNGLLRTPYMEAALAEFPNAVTLSRDRGAGMSDELYHAVMTTLEETQQRLKAGTPAGNTPAASELQLHGPPSTNGAAKVGTPPNGPAINGEVLFEGMVGKFKENGFVDRYLRLTGDSLLISATERSSKPTALPLRNIMGVTPVMESNSNQYHHVFALQEHEDKCYWFQAQDQETMYKWVTLIRKAIA